MAQKSKDAQTNATMESLARAGAPDAELAPDAQRDADGREPWERDDTAAEVATVAEAEIVEAELMEPISEFDDRAAELARREARRTSDVALRSHPATQALDRWLAEHQQAGTEADMAQGDIIAQVLNAATLEEILLPPEAIHAEAVKGIPLSIHAVKYQRSDFQEGSPFYAVLDATRHDTNERVPITVGAQTIIAQLMRLSQLSLLPARVVIINATKRPTKNGYWPLRLHLDKSGPVAE